MSDKLRPMELELAHLEYLACQPRRKADSIPLDIAEIVGELSNQTSTHWR